MEDVLTIKSTKTRLYFLGPSIFPGQKWQKILEIRSEHYAEEEMALTLLWKTFLRLSDEELCRIIQNIRNLTPNIRQSRMLEVLRRRGLRIQWWRARKCVRLVDPVKTALRRHVAICRRKHSVPYLNYIYGTWMGITK